MLDGIMPMHVEWTNS